MKRYSRSFVLLLLAVSLCLECAPDSGGGNGDGGTLREDTVELCQDGADNDRDGLVDCADASCQGLWVCMSPDADADSDTDVDADSDSGECASVRVAAEATTAPVDIIWIIDSSGSMRGEASAVQSNMNAFAAEISSSGIDFRVIVMTHRDYVDVPAPLGTDTERYLFVHQPIWSGEALDMTVSELSRYSYFLRPRAATHFVGVSDDESDTEPEDFIAAMATRLGHGFVFHAIASEEAFHDCVAGMCDPGCTGPNGDASAIGARFYELAAMTGGEQFSICTSDWSALFDTLEAAVILSAALPCFYELPAPPPGMVFDPELVNVVFTDAGGATTNFARAMDPSRCEDREAWYYDNNDAPTRIELCEAACEAVQTVTRGEVNIALGCAPDEVIY